jgi:flap endonuclease-1
MEVGIKPIWVFDGKPPCLKSKELDKRTETKAKLTMKCEAALDEGDLENASRANKSALRVTNEMKKDAKELIEHMGCPLIDAPGEAEAQCAEIVK